MDLFRWSDGQTIEKGSGTCPSKSFGIGAPRSRPRVALIVREVEQVSSDPKKWGAISGKAVVCNVPGTRLKHALGRHAPHERHKSSRMASGSTARRPRRRSWAPLSLHLKEALDGPTLVHGFEASRPVRPRLLSSLTSVWALDEKKATRVVDNERAQTRRHDLRAGARGRVPAALTHVRWLGGARGAASAGKGGPRRGHQPCPGVVLWLGAHRRN